MIERVEERHDLKPHDSSAIPPTAPVRCSTGWSRTKTSNRTCPSGRRPNATTVPSRSATSSGTRKPTSTAARRDSPFVVSGERSGSHAHITEADTIIFRSSQHDCAKCPLKPRCCPNTPMRKIARSFYERSREMARRSATPRPIASRARTERRSKCCSPPQRILKLDRLRLRGRRGARDEFLLAATAQNLRRLAKRWQQRR